MTPERLKGLRGQRGFSLFGMVFWAVVIGFVALLTMRVLPSVNEFFTIKRAINKAALDGGKTVAGIRAAFDRQKEIEYSIQSITSTDLDITKENDRVVVRFTYDKEIEVMSPVFLLIKYEGRSP